MGDMSLENIDPLFDEDEEDTMNDPQPPQPQPQPQSLPLPQPLPVPQLEANANRRCTRSTPPLAEPTDPLTKRKSAVWREFQTVKGLFYLDGKDRARCKHCKVKAYPSASNNGTTNFKNHLDKCEAYAAYLQAEAAGDGPCEPFRFEQRIYRQKLAKAIICHGYGFSFVEHDGYREVISYASGNRAKNITRNTAKSDCLKMHAYFKNQLKKQLLAIPGRISLTSDLWTSCNTEGYLCLTAHFVDSDWKLQSRVLSFVHAIPPHTGDLMSEMVFNLIKEWGLEHKIFSITLDNASSNDRMQDALKSKLIIEGSLLCSGAHFHVRCAAHILNLIVKDGLNAIDDCVSKIRDTIKHIRGSESRLLHFRATVERLHISETKALWLDVPTRWNSTYLMIDRALRYREAFSKVYLEDQQLTTSISDEDWGKVSRIHELLAPFYDITELFSGTQYPTSTLYFEQVYFLDRLLQEHLKNRDPVIKEMVERMWSKFGKYWSEYTMIFAFASILDPRHKTVTIKKCYRKLYEEPEATLKEGEVLSKLRLLFAEYERDTVPPTNITSTSASILPSPPRKRTFNYRDELDEDEDSSSVVYPSSLLDRYLQEPKLGRNVELDILDFWKGKAEEYEELSLMARDILSVPLTTVASESTFSIGGRVLDKWKSSYLPENAEALITPRSWLYGFESIGGGEYIGDEVDWIKSQSTERFSKE